MRTHLRQRIPLALGMALIVAVIQTAASPYPWPQFDGNPQHSGNNPQEAAISTGNVAALQKLFQVALPAIADGAPAVLPSVPTRQGTKDLMYLTTKAGHIIALDAHTGARVWTRQYPAGTCTVNNNGHTPCFTTSSPVADPATLTVYSYGLDGYIHAFAAGSGAEITTGGWPEPATLKDFDEKGSSALTLVTTSGGASYLYVTNAGYPGDKGDYQGHVTAINLSTGSQQVFNTMCSNQTVHFVEKPGQPDCPGVQSAVWARAGVVYDADTGKIYLSTGNGTFDPMQDYWGDSVLALNPDGTGANGGPLDSYTPANYQHLQDADLDLASTAPAILPVPVTSTVQHLAVQSGKDALLRLLNLDNLSGQGGPGHTGGEVGQPIRVPQGGPVFSQPAVWINPSDSSIWTFVANANGLSALKLVVDTKGNPSLSVIWQNTDGGTSPLIANGVLYYVNSGIVRALDPVGGTTLWSDTQIGNIHWESPVVANGILYITDEARHLTAYSPGGIVIPPGRAGLRLGR